MKVRKLVKTVERHVVDPSGWRSQPKSARVSLPYLRVLDEAVMPVMSDPDRVAARF